MRVSVHRRTGVGCGYGGFVQAETPLKHWGVPLQAYSDGWDLWAFDHEPVSHGIPEWADWFEDELNTHHAIARVGHWMSCRHYQRKERAVSRLAQLGRRERSHSASKRNGRDHLADRELQGPPAASRLVP